MNLSNDAVANHTSIKSDKHVLIPAVHVFTLKGNHILLLRRFNTGYEDGHYSVPAGHIELGEGVVEAAVRELYEECGISVQPADLHMAGVMHRKSTQERIDFFLTLSHWRGNIVNKEPDKCDDLAWYPLNQLPTNVIPYVRQSIANWENNKWFDSFGW